MNPCWQQPITALPFKVFFSNSKNNLLCNFIRKRRQTNRPVVTRVFFFTLLENWSNICQLHTSLVWSNQHKISPKEIIQWCIEKNKNKKQLHSIKNLCSLDFFQRTETCSLLCTHKSHLCTDWNGTHWHWQHILQGALPFVWTISGS